MRVLRWWPYLILVLALIGCLVGYVLLPLYLESWRAFALNLATEIVGILLVVWLIDAVLRRREEKERRRYRSVALQQLRRPLNRQAQLLFGMYKATVARKPQREISKVSDLFDKDYFEQVSRLDASAEGPALYSIGGSAVSWAEHIKYEMKGFKEDLGRVVDKYAMYLDLDTIDTAEKIIDSSFIELSYTSAMMVSGARNRQYEGPVPYLGVQEIPADSPTSTSTVSPLREYVGAFSKLVEIYDRDAQNGRQVSTTAFEWRDDVSPKIGSARISDGALRDAAAEQSRDPEGTVQPNEDGP